MAVRRVRVEPPSARTELGHVCRVGLAIVIAAWIWLGVDSTLFNDAAAGSQLLPFQELVLNRPGTEQRMFTALQEGLIEAEARRSDTGAWPTVAELADEGIPPFAFDPTLRERYTWHLVRAGATVNYLGVPERAEAPSWLLLVQEPIPGAPPDTAREDEEHNRLVTGEMLHVSTWVRAGGPVAVALVTVPQSEGWTELFAVGPSLAHAPAVRPS